MTKLTLINLTPHPLNFFRAGDVYRRGRKLWLLDPQTVPYMVLDTPVPPRPVRLQGQLEPNDFVDGIPLFCNVITDITNLPPEDLSNPVRYVVSKPAAEALWSTGRLSDILCPIDTVYISDTRVVGCTGLRCADIYSGGSYRA